MIELIYNEEEEITTEESIIKEPKNVNRLGTRRIIKKYILRILYIPFCSNTAMRRKTAQRQRFYLGKAAGVMENVTSI